MTELINYQLKEFLTLDYETVTEYIDVLKFHKPEETKKRLFDLRLRDVQSIKDYMTEGTFYDLMMCIVIMDKKDLYDVKEMKIVEFWSKILYVTEQVKSINNMERTHLASSHGNVKWEMVQGNEKMKIFGIFNTLRKLAGDDLLKYNAYLDMPYADVFTMLYMKRVAEDLEKEMEQIKLQT